MYTHVQGLVLETKDTEENQADQASTLKGLMF